MTLNGIILSGLWSIGVVLFNLIREHKINALASMAGIFSAVGLIGTIVSKKRYILLNSSYSTGYFACCSLPWFLVCGKIINQIIVEQTYLLAIVKTSAQ